MLDHPIANHTLRVSDSRSHPPNLLGGTHRGKSFAKRAAPEFPVMALIFRPRRNFDAIKRPYSARQRSWENREDGNSGSTYDRVRTIAKWGESAAYLGSSPVIGPGTVRAKRNLGFCL
jgi:hypothetical protein